MHSSVSYREATIDDVPAMRECRSSDLEAGEADSRMEAYLDAEHHPREALSPRVAYVALIDDQLVGYIAGHLTTRFGCEGEVQYLFVSLEHRRRGIATHLLRLLADWFDARGAKKVCVDVNLDSLSAAPFYLRRRAIPLSKHWFIWDDIRIVGGASA